MFIHKNRLYKISKKLRKLSDAIATPLLYIVIRLFMAQIFFQSGWLKFQNFLNGDWASTIDQFEYLHPVPGVPAAVAAVFGTAGELGLSVLLALGLLGRFAALGLIGMTCVIQFFVPAEYGVSNPAHYFWIMLLAVIVFSGAGTISLDCLLMRWLCKKDSV